MISAFYTVSEFTGGCIAQARFGCYRGFVSWKRKDHQSLVNAGFFFHVDLSSFKIFFDASIRSRCPARTSTVTVLGRAYTRNNHPSNCGPGVQLCACGLVNLPGLKGAYFPVLIAMGDLIMSQSPILAGGINRGCYSTIQYLYLDSLDVEPAHSRPENEHRVLATN